MSVNIEQNFVFAAGVEKSYFFKFGEYATDVKLSSTERKRSRLLCELMVTPLPDPVWFTIARRVPSSKFQAAFSTILLY